MRYKPRSVAALHIALGGLPGKMPVEVEPQTLACQQRPLTNCGR